MTPTITSQSRTDIAKTLAAATRDPLHVNTQKLYPTSAATTCLWRVPQTNVATVVAARAQHLTSQAQDEQRNWTIVMIASVLLAITMLWLANKLDHEAATEAGRAGRVDGR